jgi:hypothetical protein
MARRRVTPRPTRVSGSTRESSTTLPSSTRALQNSTERRTTAPLTMQPLATSESTA